MDNIVAKYSDPLPCDTCKKALAPVGQFSRTRNCFCEAFFGTGNMKPNGVLFNNEKCPEYEKDSMTAEDGGPGSGNHGHAGRPGQVGGSAPGEGGSGKKEENNITVDPDFDVFELIEREAKEYAARGPEFQKKAEEAIRNLEKSGKILNAAKAAKSCDGDTRKFLEMISPINRLILEQQHHEIGTDETFPDYIKRIQQTLASDPQYEEKPSSPVEGVDITRGYHWSGVPYTESKFRQLIDTEIEDVICKQGFNGAPRVLKKEEFDEFVTKHAELPIMFRTYTAPNKKTLDQFDGDLESGAWYVDCSVGGAKYGQGMYTAYAPSRHIIDYDSQYIKKTDDGFPDEVIRDASGRLWQYDPNHEYTGPRGTPEGYAIFCSEDIGGKNEVFIVKEKGRTLQDASGEEYGFDVLYGMHGLRIMKPITEEEAKTPDVSRPLGQMQMYKSMNEGREARVYVAYSAMQSGAYRDLETPVPIIATATYNSKRDMFDGKLYAFKADTKKGVPLIDTVMDADQVKLKDGFYILDMEEHYNGIKPKREAEFFQVIDGKVKIDNHRDDILNFYARNPGTFRNAKVYPAKKLPTPKPCTSTRRMTMDPSANFVQYEQLKEEYDRYRGYEGVGIKNIGAYAAAKGYDAIVCNNYGKTIVVLNRTKLIISEEKVEVPREEAS